MLVNLSEKPRATVKDRRYSRRLVRECRKFLNKKFISKFKQYCGFKKFEKYEPSGYEYVKDTVTDFNGCWVYWFNVFDVSANITKFCNQHALDATEYGFSSFEYWNHYGLCDNASQAIKFYEDCKKQGYFPGNHVIMLRPMTGEFRWHKWGKYIGKFKPLCEYFSDEQGIQMVYAFSIVRIV